MVITVSSDMQHTHKTKVNGTLLPRFINKNVSIIGTVLKTSPNGRSFDIQTGDRHVISVNLQEPLDELMTGLVEIQGVVKNKDTILCDYLINFPPEMAETFDMELDNEAAILVNNVPNPWR